MKTAMKWFGKIGTGHFENSKFGNLYMMKKDLSQQELSRYNRQMILSEIGENGQQKLLNTRVLVVGTGGLGSPVLQILTASGIGIIGIIDGDKVDMTNLHRQFLFSEDDI